MPTGSMGQVSCIGNPGINRQDMANLTQYYFERISDEIVTYDTDLEYLELKFDTESDEFILCKWVNEGGNDPHILSTGYSEEDVTIEDVRKYSAFKFVAPIFDLGLLGKFYFIERGYVDTAMKQHVLLEYLIDMKVISKQDLKEGEEYDS